MRGGGAGAMGGTGAADGIWLFEYEGGEDLEAEQLKKGEPTMAGTETGQRLTVVIQADLLDRLRNAVYWSAGLTLTALVEDALAETIDRMERKNGKPFPHRMEPMKRGRPKLLKPAGNNVRELRSPRRGSGYQPSPEPQEVLAATDCRPAQVGA